MDRARRRPTSNHLAIPTGTRVGYYPRLLGIERSKRLRDPCAGSNPQYKWEC